MARRLKRLCALVLAEALASAALAAEDLCDFTTERFKYAKLHLQGIDCDESGVYYGFANGVDGRHGVVKVRFWEFADNALVPWTRHGSGLRRGETQEEEGK